METELQKRLEAKLAIAKRHDHDKWICMSAEDREIYPEFDTLSWNTQLPVLKAKLQTEIQNDMIRNSELRTNILNKHQTDLKCKCNMFTIYRRLADQIRNLDANGIHLFIDYISNCILFYEIRYLQSNGISYINCRTYQEIIDLYKKSIKTEDDVLIYYNNIIDKRDSIETILDNVYQLTLIKKAEDLMVFFQIRYPHNFFD